MPAQELAFRRQRALLWEKTGVDKFNEPLLALPVEIWVRWNHKRIEKLDAQGNTVKLDATAIVDRDIPIASLMWLAPDASYAAIDQWYGSGSGLQDDELMTVITCDKVKDIKNRVTHRKVTMMRYKKKPV